MLSIEHLSLLVIRVVFGGFMLLSHGLPKLRMLLGGGSPATHLHDADPAFALVLTVASEFLCALFIIAGLFTRWASLPLLVAVVAGVYSSMKSGANQNVELLTLYFGAFTVLLLKGGGRWSLDRYIFRPASKSGRW